MPFTLSATLRAAHVVERERLVEQADERPDRRRGVVVLRLARAAAPSGLRRRAGSRHCRASRRRSCLSRSPRPRPRARDCSRSRRRARRSTCRCRPRPAPGDLVKISASGPMPTSRYCDHRPFCCSSFFSSIACGEPGLSLLDRAAERALDFGARLRRALRRAARLLLDDAFEQRDREGDARRLHGLQVDRREQPRACSGRACPPPCWRGSRRDRRCGPHARRRPPRPDRAASHRSRMVAKAREMSNTPSWRIATTEGPPSSGRHTRPTRVPAVESVGRVDLGSNLQVSWSTR